MMAKSLSNYAGYGGLYEPIINREGDKVLQVKVFRMGQPYKELTRENFNVSEKYIQYWFNTFVLNCYLSGKEIKTKQCSFKDFSSSEIY